MAFFDHHDTDDDAIKVHFTLLNTLNHFKLIGGEYNADAYYPTMISKEDLDHIFTPKFGVGVNWKGIVLENHGALHPADDDDEAVHEFLNPFLDPIQRRTLRLWNSCDPEWLKADPEWLKAKSWDEADEWLEDMQWHDLSRDVFMRLVNAARILAEDNTEIDCLHRILELMRCTCCTKWRYTNNTYSQKSSCLHIAMKENFLGEHMAAGVIKSVQSFGGLQSHLHVPKYRTSEEEVIPHRQAPKRVGQQGQLLVVEEEVTPDAKRHKFDLFPMS